MTRAASVYGFLLAVALGAALTLWGAGGRPDEPATFWTDYALAAQAALFGGWLLRRPAAEAQGLAAGWAGAFVAVGLAAALGGSSHALASHLATDGLWLGALGSLGVASFFLLAVTLVPRLAPRERTIAWVVLVAELVAYGAWVVLDPDFLNAMIQYGGALTVLLAVELVAWIRRGSVGAAWRVGGVAISAAAAAIQRSSLGWAALNHNDLYHLVQLLGTWFLFEGARRRVAAVREGDAE